MEDAPTQKFEPKARTRSISPAELQPAEVVRYPYRKIYRRFWRDKRVAVLPAIQKLIALYCITSHQSNRVGIFSFSPAMAEEDIGTLPGTIMDMSGGTLDPTRATFRENFDAVIVAMGWKWDPELRVLYIPSWWKWNRPENANVLKGNLKDLRDVPKSVLLQEFICNTQHLEPDLVETFTRTLPLILPETLPQFRKQETGNSKQRAETQSRLGSSSIRTPASEQHSRARAKDGTGVSNETAVQGTIKRKSAFDSLTVDVLRDDQRLLAWFKDASGRRKPVITWTEANLLHVFGAAERALELGDAPVGLFARIVAGAAWGMISNDQADRARNRIRHSWTGWPPEHIAPPPRKRENNGAQPISQVLGGRFGE